MEINLIMKKKKCLLMNLIITYLISNINIVISLSSSSSLSGINNSNDIYIDILSNHTNNILYKEDSSKNNSVSSLVRNLDEIIFNNSIYDSVDTGESSIELATTTTISTEMFDLSFNNSSSEAEMSTLSPIFTFYNNNNNYTLINGNLTWLQLPDRATTQKNSGVYNDIPFYTIALSVIMYSLIFLVGFFGNSLVIIVAFLNRSQQHSAHYCLVNLSIADLLLIIVCMPSAVLELFSQEIWYLGAFLCKITAWLEHTIAHASILTIVAISIERSLAIAYPLKAKQFFTSKRLWLVVVLIWTLSTLSTIPIMIATRHIQGYHKKLARYVDICVVATRESWQLAYLFITLFLFYLLPCILLFLLYGNVVLIIKNRNKKNSLLNPFKSNSCTDSINIQNNNLVRENTAVMSLNQEIDTSKKQASLTMDSCDPNIPHTRSTSCKSIERLTTQIPNKQKLSINSDKSSVQMISNKRRANPSLPNLTNQKQIIVLLIVMMLLILISLLPYRVFSLWFAMASKQQLTKLGVVKYHNIITFCRVAFYTNSALNPIFYHIISTKFQNAFKRFFKLHNTSFSLSTRKQNYQSTNNNSTTSCNNGRRFTHQKSIDIRSYSPVKTNQK